MNIFPVHINPVRDSEGKVEAQSKQISNGVKEVALKLTIFNISCLSAETIASLSPTLFCFIYFLFPLLHYLLPIRWWLGDKLIFNSSQLAQLI